MLTIKQQRVLEHLLKGYSNKNIANILCVSEKAIEYHRANIYRYFKASSIASLLEKLSTSGFILPNAPADLGPDLSWRGTLKGEMTYFSANLYDVTGFQHHELCFKAFRDWAPLFIHESFLSGVQRSLKSRARGSYGVGPVRFDVTFLEKNGNSYIAEVHSQPLYSEDNEIICIQGSNRIVNPIENKIII